MKFHKEVEQNHFGSISARIVNERGTYVSAPFFVKERKSLIKLSTEERFKIAHEWADKELAVIEKYQITNNN